jgi:hypothetical protein
MDHLTFAQLLGSYGEFIGSIAILATLVYLAIQVRQVREEQIARTLDQRTEYVRDWNLRAATTPSLVKALVKARDAVGAEHHSFVTELVQLGLTAEEATQVLNFQTAGFRVNLSQFQAIQDPEQAAQNDEILRLVYGHGLGRVYWRHQSERLSGAIGSFKTHVDALISNT